MSGQLHSRQSVARTLGTELRALRQERGHPLRVVAAAAEMDPALLSKAETGKRLPTAAQLVAIAAFFKIPAPPLEARRVAAEVKRRFGDNPAFAEATVLLREDAGEYPVKRMSVAVNKDRPPVNKRKKTP